MLVKHLNTFVILTTYTFSWTKWSHTENIVITTKEHFRRSFHTNEVEGRLHEYFRSNTNSSDTPSQDGHLETCYTSYVYTGLKALALQASPSTDEEGF